MHKLGVCVPYRNRGEHLEKFIPHMTKILTDQNINFKIYIAHQKDDEPFNRGKLLNSAFTEAVKEGCDYFAFHDIDMLPIEGHADYSYPEEYPVLISTEIDEYDFKPPYKEYFGGCVMFSRNQFEMINGFGNDYRGWGAEDDDLFWRVRSKDLIDVEKTPFTPGERSVACFNGENSSVELLFKNEPQGVKEGNYTVSLLLKPECYRRMTPYIYGDPAAFYEATPILNRHNFDIIAYCNTQDVKALSWNRENISSEAFAKIRFGDWVQVTAVFNSGEKSVVLYINGKCVAKNSDAPGEMRNYYGTPFFIGRSDIPKWHTHKDSYFWGSVAEICFWDKPLSDDEISAMYGAKEYLPQGDNLVVHYDFSQIEDGYVQDLSGRGNHGRLENIEINREFIGSLIVEEGPFRRNNRYTTLKHEKQGVVNGTMVQSENSIRNINILNSLIKEGKESFFKTGLTTLEYELLNCEKISDRAVILDLAI